MPFIVTFIAFVLIVIAMSIAHCADILQGIKDTVLRIEDRMKEHDDES